MKYLTIVSAILAVTVAKPTFLLTPLAVSSQYHSQNELGHYSYGYSSPLSSKSEVKTADGITRGSYSYIDAEGKLQSVQYTSDTVNGFRVAATNLPLAPTAPEALPQPEQVKDTPEVEQAKTQHLAAVEEAKAKIAAAPVEVVQITAPLVHSHTPFIGYTAYSYGGYPYITPYYYAAPVALPTAPEDTPEVAKAKAEHLAAVEEATTKTS